MELARLRGAEAEALAIVRIQALDVAFASDAAELDAAQLDARRLQLARQVEAELAALPSWRAASTIQRGFRDGRQRKAAAKQRQAEAEAAEKAAAQAQLEALEAQAAAKDSPEDAAIIRNLCKRTDLGWFEHPAGWEERPSAMDVRAVLKAARGTKSRMPEVVRLLRRKGSRSAGGGRRGGRESSPEPASRQAVGGEPVEVGDLPAILGFMLQRARAESVAPSSPPTSPPSAAAARPAISENVPPSAAADDGSRQERRRVQQQLEQLRKEHEAERRRSASLTAQLSTLRLQLQAVPDRPASPQSAQGEEGPASSLRAEWDSAASTIQAQYTRWRHQQDMRALISAAKKDADRLNSLLDERNAQLQQHQARIEMLDSSNAQLVSKGSAQIVTVEQLQAQVAVLEEWQRNQHHTAGQQQAVHAAALSAEREARAAAIADAEEWKSAVTIQNQYSRWRAQQDMREILSAHRSQLNESEEQTRALRQELQEQQRQSAADGAASAQVSTNRLQTMYLAGLRCSHRCACVPGPRRIDGRADEGPRAAGLGDTRA